MKLTFKAGNELQFTVIQAKARMKSFSKTTDGSPVDRMNGRIVTASKCKITLYAHLYGLSPQCMVDAMKYSLLMGHGVKYKFFK